MTNPQKRTLNNAEESGSLALTTDTTSGETSDTAFIDRKKAKAVPNTAIVRQISTLYQIQLETYPINRVKEITKEPCQNHPQPTVGTNP